MKAKTQTFQFTLVLKNVHEKTNDLEDSLFESGCDDALINFRNGAVYLDFDRDAISFEDAIISAIKNVQASSVDAIVVSVAPENLVTESEIAKRLNVTRQTVSLWIKGERRKAFPHPILRLAEKSPLWSWSEVTNWLYEHQLISKEIVENAALIANINAALDERDTETRKIRHRLLERINAH